MSDIWSEKTTPNLSFFVFKRHIFGVDKESGGVFEVLEDERRVCLRFIVEPVTFRRKAISKALVHGNYIIFIPFNYDKVVCYDTIEKLWREVDLGIEDDRELFLDAELVDDEIILLPFNSRFLVKVNLNTFNIRKINLCEVCSLGQRKNIVIKHVLENEECVLFPVFNSNILIRYYTKENKFEKYRIDNKDFRINSIACGGEKLFLESRNSLEVLVTDRDFNVEKSIALSKKIQPLGDEYTYFDQSGFEWFAGNLYCFPARWNQAIKIDTETYEFTTLSSMSELTQGSEKISKFNHGIVVDSRLYIQHFNEKIVIFDMRTEKYDVLSTEMNDPDGVFFRGFLDYIVSF